MATLVKWSVEDYHRMIEAGILAKHRCELIEGEIVKMAPEGEEHIWLSEGSTDYLKSLLQGRAWIREAHPITLSDSEPEPDIAILRLPRTRYRHRKPTPEDIYWLIEIADCTLSRDTGEKLKLYARACILEYWVIDIKAKRLIAYRTPDNNEYRDRQEYRQGNIFSWVFPDVAIAIERLLREG